MQQLWKAAVLDYVRRRNRMETHYEWIEDGFIQDSRDDFKIQQGLKRIKEWHKERGVQPIRSESSIRILHHRAVEDRLNVTVMIQKTTHFRQGQLEYDESRIDIERLELRQQGNQWNIRTIVRDVPERSSFFYDRNIKWKQKKESQPLIRVPALQTNGLHRPGKRHYDRNKAKAYADMWWDHPNPNFMSFDVDCTNFVSQCLYAGGAPINYTGKRESGWWYRWQNGKDQWSFSWSVSNSLKRYLSSSQNGLRAEQLDDPRGLDIGDCIIYDWDGDGRYQHSTIVTSKDASGMPLVNAHTINSKNRYWDYRDSPAWTPRTVYCFMHIIDDF
ncbi:amidase domain-containing protein [Marinicrinis lubricantis]|uniref:Amidase domain-containing protein n=1 Tax=Marinicrinis lubricantis TaxID=2086470 RepID=A0ABW1IJ89_9BACL